MPRPNKPIGGGAYHVGDCYVWSAIYYLDSATDYREYVQQQRVHSHAIGDDLVMLDSQRNLPWPQTRFGRLSVFVMLTLLIGALLCFLALLVEKLWIPQPRASVAEISLDISSQGLAFSISER